MIIGSISLAVGAYLTVSNFQFGQRALPVKSKIVDYGSFQSQNSKSRGYTTMYSPKYEYSFEGKTYLYKSSVHSSVQEFRIGEIVEVLVDPREPQNPQINTFLGRWFLASLLVFLGTLFSGLGYMAYRVLGREVGAKED